MAESKKELPFQIETSDYRFHCPLTERIHLEVFDGKQIVFTFNEVTRFS